MLARTRSARSGSQAQVGAAEGDDPRAPPARRPRPRAGPTRRRRRRPPPAPASSPLRVAQTDRAGAVRRRSPSTAQPVLTLAAGARRGRRRRRAGHRARSRRPRSRASAAPRCPVACGSTSRSSPAPRRRRPGTPFSRPRRSSSASRGELRLARSRRSACRCARPGSRARRSRRRARARPRRRAAPSAIPAGSRSRRGSRRSSGRSGGRRSAARARAPRPAAPSWRRASSRATASPTIPAPTTTTSHSRGRRRSAGTHRDDPRSAVALPLKPPVKPQLALSRKELPDGRGLGRTSRSTTASAPLAFVDGDEVFLQSRTGKPLRRYFPELEFPAGRYVIDGELVILDDDGREEFDALQNRLHPAESRVRDARRGDAGAVPRLRPARRRRRKAARRAVRGAPRRRSRSWSTSGVARRRPGSIELTPLVDDRRATPRPGSRPARA